MNNYLSLVVLSPCVSVCLRPNIVYVASNHFVWRLVPVPIASQIRQLLQDKQFELALQLANMKDDVEGDKRQQIHHIQNLYAFNLFCQKRFDDSMQVFAKLGTGEVFYGRRLRGEGFGRGVK
ncbi:unnamed protein product [Oncorhynchus mykiss]|uniref:Uncharacterized protein n=1 Tax=Oncorhynchus mykiss TaxID=8022 RepID=A0A060YQM5_ONCMY|nr:unnamed protein product [Oncorhynchus mykiss]